MQKGTTDRVVWWVCVLVLLDMVMMAVLFTAQRYDSKLQLQAKLRHEAAIFCWQRNLNEHNELYCKNQFGAYVSIERIKYTEGAQARSK